MRASEREQRRARRESVQQGLASIAHAGMSQTQIRQWVQSLPREVLEAIVLEATLRAAGKETR